MPAEPPVISATLPMCSPARFSVKPTVARRAPLASAMLATAGTG
jgi:hypothetical protein